MTPTERETEAIREGMAAAAQKRSHKPVDMERMRPKFDIRKMGSPLPADAYCEECTYPMTEQGCECDAERRRQAERMRQAIQSIGGLQAWQDFTLNGFVETEHNRAALAAVRAFHPEHHNIYLHSPTSGTGKSRMAAIAKRPWILKGVKCVTLSLDDFYLELREHLKSARDQRAVIDRLINMPLLGVDDLGAEKDSEFAINALFRVVEGRKNAKRNGLIITSNISLDFLGARHGNQRVSSRISELCGNGRHVFNLSGEKDWRKESK